MLDNDKLKGTLRKQLRAARRALCAVGPCSALQARRIFHRPAGRFQGGPRIAVYLPFDRETDTCRLSSPRRGGGGCASSCPWSRACAIAAALLSARRQDAPRGVRDIHPAPRRARARGRPTLVRSHRRALGRRRTDRAAAWGWAADSTTARSTCGVTGAIGAVRAWSGSPSTVSAPNRSSRRPRTCAWMPWRRNRDSSFIGAIDESLAAQIGTGHFQHR